MATWKIAEATAYPDNLNHPMLRLTVEASEDDGITDTFEMSVAAGSHEGIAALVSAEVATRNTQAVAESVVGLSGTS